jgi:hypothetical protein
MLPVRSKENTTSALGIVPVKPISLTSFADSPGLSVAVNTVGEMDVEGSSINTGDSVTSGGIYTLGALRALKSGFESVPSIARAGTQIITADRIKSVIKNFVAFGFLFTMFNSPLCFYS